MIADLHATVAERLRGEGQRYTRARRTLVDLLVGAGRPLGIGEIVTRSRGLPQSSVYRNLAQLEQAGAVRKVAGADELARYELAEELTEHHHHLVCTNCGSVADYTMSPRVERSVEKAIEAVAAATGFRVQSHRLDLVGLCANCE